MFDVQGALGPLQGLGTWSHRALREVCLHKASQALEVVMAGVAEVGGPKAEIDGHRTAVAALVLQEVSAMLGTHLMVQKWVISYRATLLLCCQTAIFSSSVQGQTFSHPPPSQDTPSSSPPYLDSSSNLSTGGTHQFRGIVVVTG